MQMLPQSSFLKEDSAFEQQESESAATPTEHNLSWQMRPDIFDHQILAAASVR